ncbi:MAG TPA: hypothetical protein VMV87_06345 [Burkholderiales bacterium]|nr:hypothetical protein [Burkholderiales bacterium]
MLVLSEQFALGRARKAFNEDGGLKRAKQQAATVALAQRLFEVSAKPAA